MIKYRPHRGTLDDAMKEYQEFDSVVDMFRHIEEKSDGMISASDLSIKESIGADYRIEWKSTRYICTKRFASQYFDTPICIGMCDLGEKDVTEPSNMELNMRNDKE